MRRKFFDVLGVAAMTGLVATGAYGAAKKTVKVQLQNSQGHAAGNVTFSSAKNGVKMNIKLENMAFGEHGVHLHQNATCDAPDFKGAGGHFNPTGKKHGFENPDGHHAGDLPKNVSVGEDHRGEATFVLTDVTLEPGAPNSLFANGGTSVVVHEKADDMKTDPAGNAGNRIACGVVKE